MKKHLVMALALLAGCVQAADERRDCVERCDPVPCGDPEGDGAWECDWSGQPCAEQVLAKAEDCGADAPEE